jgi:hypothetical protein
MKTTILTARSWITAVHTSPGSRAASKGFADDGTYTGSTDRRYYQLESSNNGEDEGETHFVRRDMGSQKRI